MTQLLGRKPNRIATSQMLGRLAFLDRVPAALQGMALLSVSTPAAASSVDLVALDGSFASYLIAFDNLVPATNNDTLSLRTSADNGSTFDSGAGSYVYTGSETYSGIGSAAFVSSTGDTKVILHSTTTVSSTASNGGISGVVQLRDPAQSSGYHHLQFSAAWFSEAFSGVIASVNGAAARKSSSAINALRLYFAGGNITSGTVRVYGLAA